jgi:hypothetical protein
MKTESWFLSLSSKEKAFPKVHKVSTDQDSRSRSQTQPYCEYASRYSKGSSYYVLSQCLHNTFRLSNNSMEVSQKFQIWQHSKPKGQNLCFQLQSQLNCHHQPNHACISTSIRQLDPSHTPGSSESLSAKTKCNSRTCANNPSQLPS